MTYDPCPEMDQIVVDLIQKRQDLFGEMSKYIFPEMFVCALRIDKPAPKKQKDLLEIRGVKGVFSVLNKYKHYIICGYESMWQNTPKEKKIAWVANMLKRVEFPTEEEMQKLIDKGKDFEYGKTKKPDTFDFRAFLKDPKLGLDWAEEGIPIGNILEDTDVLENQ